MLLKICDAVARLLERVLIALGVILLVMVALLVAGRYVPFVPRWLWPLELANWAMIWMVFIGASLAVREKTHFNVDLFLGKTLRRPLHVALKILYYAVVGFVTFTFVVFGYEFVVEWAMIQTSEILIINLGFLYVSVPIAGLLWVLFLIEDYYRDFIEKKPARGEAA